MIIRDGKTRKYSCDNHLGRRAYQIIPINNLFVSNTFIVLDLQIGRQIISSKIRKEINFLFLPSKRVITGLEMENSGTA
jgi:hypothetical protein